MAMQKKRRMEDSTAEAERHLTSMLEVAGLIRRPSYSPKAISLLLDVSLTTIYKMLKNGTFVRMEAQARIRVSHQSLLDYVAEQIRNSME